MLTISRYNNTVKNNFQFHREERDLDIGIIKLTTLYKLSFNKSFVLKYSVSNNKMVKKNA